jgi:hypothetical protein
MYTETFVDIQGPLDQIVALAADVERWPEILPHYRWVTLLAGGGDRKLVEMAARRGRIPIRWRALQEINRSGPTPVITYRHTWGVTRGMNVAWMFAPAPESVRVAISHNFAPDWPRIGVFVADTIIGPHFVEYVAGRTLGRIKEIVEEHQGSIW